MTETTTPKKSANCGCLCGENVSPRSIFRQGHDQRMVGELALRVAEGNLTNQWVERLQLPTEVDNNDIQERINLTSGAVAKFYTEALARKFTVAAHNRWDKVVRDSQPKKVRQPQVKAKTASAAEERKFAKATGLDLPKKPVVQQAAEANEITLGAPVRVKVGRWEYDATVHGMNQAGRVTAVRYYDKNDKEFVKIEGKFKIVG